MSGKYNLSKKQKELLQLCSKSCIKQEGVEFTLNGEKVNQYTVWSLNQKGLIEYSSPDVMVLSEKGKDYVR